MREYGQRVPEIIAHAKDYHQAYYEVGTFTGPSLCFHRKPLENRNRASLGRRLEYIYATLAAWGGTARSRAGVAIDALQFDLSRV